MRSRRIDHRMLEVRRVVAVRRDDRPAVFEQLDVARARVDHRLDGEHHSLLQPRVRARTRRSWAPGGPRAWRNPCHGRSTPARRRRHCAVACSYTAREMSLILLPGRACATAALEAFARDLHEPFALLRGCPHRERDRRIGEVSVEVDAEIDADDVTLPELSGPGDPVDDLVVQGDAQRSGIVHVAEEGRFAAVAFDPGACEGVQLTRADSRSTSFLSSSRVRREDGLIPGFRRSPFRS